MVKQDKISFGRFNQFSRINTFQLEMIKWDKTVFLLILTVFGTRIQAALTRWGYKIKN